MTQQPHNVINLARYRQRMAARRMAQHRIRSQQQQAATTGYWQNYSSALATTAMTYAASWPSPLAAAIGWPGGRP